MESKLKFQVIIAIFDAIFHWRELTKLTRLSSHKQLESLMNLSSLIQWKLLPQLIPDFAYNMLIINSKTLLVSPSAVRFHLLALWFASVPHIIVSAFLYIFERSISLTDCILTLFFKLYNNNCPSYIQLIRFLFGAKIKLYCNNIWMMSNLSPLEDGDIDNEASNGFSSTSFIPEFVHRQSLKKQSTGPAITV